MIYIVTHHDFARTTWELKRWADRGALAFIRPLSYRALFNARRAPIGHYIFGDFDRLSAYEIQVADVIARGVLKAAPAARILNRPALVLERFAMLRRLAELKINDFNAYRLEDGEMPRRYPVFIRCEDDCKAPDTPLLQSAAEFTAAVSQLQAEGLPIKRRIAVEFCAKPNADGMYSKYGVFKVGGHLVPHHIQRHTDWYVKRGSPGRRRIGVDEEMDRFVNEIPDAEAIERAFQVARIDCGRIDYGIVDGRVQTYEINTNPTWPPLSVATATPGAEDRRALIRDRMMTAFREIDGPLDRGTVRFDLPEPRFQKFDPLPLRARWLSLFEQFRLAIGR
jgi:hypothetical protein